VKQHRVITLYKDRDELIRKANLSSLATVDSYHPTKVIHYYYYSAMHFSAQRGIAIACRLSVCHVGGL